MFDRLARDVDRVVRVAQTRDPPHDVLPGGEHVGVVADPQRQVGRERSPGDRPGRACPAATDGVAELLLGPGVGGGRDLVDVANVGGVIGAKRPECVLAGDEIMQEQDGGLALHLKRVIGNQRVGDLAAGLDLVLELAVGSDADDMEAVEDEWERRHVPDTREPDVECRLRVAGNLGDCRGYFPERVSHGGEVWPVGVLDEPDGAWVVRLEADGWQEFGHLSTLRADFGPSARNHPPGRSRTRLGSRQGEDYGRTPLATALRTGASAEATVEQTIATDEQEKPDRRGRRLPLVGAERES